MSNCEPQSGLILGLAVCQAVRQVWGLNQLRVKEMRFFFFFFFGVNRVNLKASSELKVLHPSGIYSVRIVGESKLCSYDLHGKPTFDY